MAALRARMPGALLGARFCDHGVALLVSALLLAAGGARGQSIWCKGGYDPRDVEVPGGICTCSSGYFVSGNTGRNTPTWHDSYRYPPTCVACPAGKSRERIFSRHARHFDAAFNAGCVACPAGQFSRRGSGCQACGAGQHSAAEGATSCVGLPCPAGTYGPTGATSAGETSCTACAAGQYLYQPASRHESPSCRSCATGLYSEANATRCSHCEPGTFSSSIGARRCADCAVGRFAASEGASACTDCPAGTFGIAMGAISADDGCDVCRPGQYQVQANRRRRIGVSIAEMNCHSCDPGRFSASEGASDCTECSFWLGADEGATECTSLSEFGILILIVLAITLCVLVYEASRKCLICILISESQKTAPTIGDERSDNDEAPAVETFEEDNPVVAAVCQIFSVDIKTLTGQTFSVEIDMLEFISSVKEKLYEESGVPPNEQRLIAPGSVELLDAHTVADCAIIPGMTLHLVLKLVDKLPNMPVDAAGVQVSCSKLVDQI